MERMADSCHLGSILQWKCAKIKPGSFDDTAGGLPCLQGPCNRLRSDVYHGTAGAVTKARICVAVDDCSLCAYVQDVIAVIGIADILFLLRDKMKRGVINGSFGKF